MNETTAQPTILIDGDEVSHDYFYALNWDSYRPGDVIPLHVDFIPQSAVFIGLADNVVTLETNEESYQ